MGKKDRKHNFAFGQKLLAPFHYFHYEQDYEVIMITKIYNIIPAINYREKSIQFGFNDMTLIQDERHTFNKYVTNLFQKSLITFFSGSPPMAMSIPRISQF